MNKYILENPRPGIESAEIEDNEWNSAKIIVNKIGWSEQTAYEDNLELAKHTYEAIFQSPSQGYAKPVWREV